MKFLSAIGGALKKVGQGVDKVTDIIDPLAPFIGVLPVIGGPFGMIFKLIADAENLATDSTGAQKKAAVLSFVKLAYPKLDVALASSEIDNLVGILNRLAKAMPHEPKKEPPNQCEFLLALERILEGLEEIAGPPKGE